MVQVQTYKQWQNNTHPNWYMDAGLRKSMASIFILYLCVFTFGYDGALLGGLQTMPTWKAYFDHPTGNRLGLISAVFYFPKIPAPFVAAWLSERFGRRVPLLVGSFLSVAGALLTGLAQKGDGMFMAGRALLGGGLAFQAIVAPPLLGELCHPRLRAVTAASYYCTYYIGSTVASWLCYAFINTKSNWGWRIPTLVQMTGTVIVGIWILLGLMPESPRWLVSRGRGDEALKILANMHANGDTNDELVQNSFREIEQSIARDAEAAKTGYIAFFKTVGNRKRFITVLGIGFASQFIGNGLVSYYIGPILRLIGVTKPAQQAGINAGLSMWNLLIAAGAAQFVERWGRRPLWLTGAVGMLFAFCFVTGLSGEFAKHKHANVGIAVIPFLYIFYGFYDICLTILPTLYIPEIMPFHLRSKGMAIYGFSQAVAVSFNQWVNPVALAAIAWKYYFVYIAIQIAFIAFAWYFLRETKGLTIEEVSLVFDKSSRYEAEETLQSEIESESASQPGKQGVATEKVEVDPNLLEYKSSRTI